MPPFSAVLWPCVLLAPPPDCEVEFVVRLAGFVAVPEPTAPATIDMVAVGEALTLGDELSTWEVVAAGVADVVPDLVLDVVGDWMVPNPVADADSVVVLAGVDDLESVVAVEALGAGELQLVKYGEALLVGSAKEGVGDSI